jgi:hypothetical protein
VGAGARCRPRVHQERILLGYCPGRSTRRVLHSAPVATHLAGRRGQPRPVDHTRRVGVISLPGGGATCYSLQ